MKRNLGIWLVFVGVALLTVTLVTSAMLAPPKVVVADGANETVVGVQGIGTSGNVHMVNGSEEVWRLDDTPAYFEVEQLPNGSVVAAFIEDGYQQCGEYDPPCPRTGYRIIDPDSDPRVVSEWSFPVRSEVNSEVHAVEPLPNGGFAVADMEYERLAIIEDGSIVWEWRAGSYYDAPSDPTTVDWLHINDVNYIGDDRFLLSVRNANQLIIVERDEGVVEVINEGSDTQAESACVRSGEVQDYDEDGEVRCGDPAVLNRQHNPHWLGNGAVLVADSDNDRVVELHRTDNGSWEPAWVREGAGSIPFKWPRDADRLPSGNTLISDTWNERILEINETGQVIWSISTDVHPYEADRLPYGERAGVPVYSQNGTIEEGDAEPSGDIPVLSTIVVALHAATPMTPFWIGELHVFVGLVSIGLVVIGAVLWYRVT